MSSALSRSSTSPLDQAVSSAVDRIVDAVRSVAAANAVVLVDGRSGAGKTTLARLIVDRWPSRGPVQLVALDSLYPGWDGLDAGVETARRDILTPHARGSVGVWRRWDWVAEAPAEDHAVDPALPLVVEGAGLLTPETARLGDVRVWLEAPADARRRRALARDGEGFRPHWERWATQEQTHLERHDPRSLADVVVALP